LIGQTPYDSLSDSVPETARMFRQTRSADAAPEARTAGGRVRSVTETRRASTPPRLGFEAIVHAPSSPITAAIGLARRATEYDISVLITGASGTGKELLARAIHHGSSRAGRPFVVENCGALPDQLLESELFGCKKGAFTGAYQDRIGLFEVADGGTIFLDEIGETSPSFQVKLLRVLQEGEIRPLGAQRTRKVNVRVVSATNRDLETEVAAGRFRRDLYYRLAAFPIHIPSLADRAVDIPAIAERILKDVNQAFHRAVPGFLPETLDLMMAYDWPGNVRELHNEIQRMVALSDSDRPLAPDLLSARIVSPRAPRPDAAGTTLKDRVEALEKVEIAETLAHCNGNISHAAERLGLSRVGLRAKMQRYQLRRSDAGDED
jgi:two-component system response regulator HupR/HoxA